MSTRRQFIGAVAAGLAGLAAPARAQAPGAAQAGLDGWPARSVRVISPTGTGGPGQNFRLYAEQLKDTFGQSFVLENMPGGSGAIGSMTVARAAPDGLTLLLASNSHIVLAPLVLTNSPVNVKRDYAAIALMFTFPFLLVVNPDETIAHTLRLAKFHNFNTDDVLRIAAESSRPIRTCLPTEPAQIGRSGIHSRGRVGCWGWGGGARPGRGGRAVSGSVRAVGRFSGVGRVGWCGGGCWVAQRTRSVVRSWTPWVWGCRRKLACVRL